MATAMMDLLRSSAPHGEFNASTSASSPTNGNLPKDGSVGTPQRGSAQLGGAQLGGIVAEEGLGSIHEPKSLVRLDPMLGTGWNV